MKLRTGVSNILDGISRILFSFAGVLLAFLVLVVSYDVAARHFLGKTLLWCHDVATYSLLYITFLSVTWVLKEERHVKMDLVLNRLNPRAQAVVNIITSIFSALACLLLAWYGAVVIRDCLQAGYRAPTFLAPPLWPMLAIIPVGSFMLAIQLLRQSYGFIRSWRRLSNKGSEG